MASTRGARPASLMGMAIYEFFTVDVFTEQRFGGNPLAVFPHAAGLSDRQMQRLARELNLSETTFVLPPADPAHTAQVRIFTPTSELPFAGHPNVGTAFVLAQLAPSPSASLLFEELAGLVTVEIERNGEGRPTGAKITAPQPLQLGREIPAEFIARCVGLPADAVSPVSLDTHRPRLAGVGVDMVIAELTSRAALAQARPSLADFQASLQHFPGLDHFELHLYVRDGSDRTKLATRMFAPLLGIQEDPATGSANAALAALLVHLERTGPGTTAFAIEQGVEMGRPSQLRATATKAADGSVRATIAGDCIPVFRGSIDL